MQVSDIIAAGGGVAKLATAIGVHHTSVICWRKAERVPAERVRAVAQATGVPPHVIRPDLFDAPEPRPTRAEVAA